MDGLRTANEQHKSEFVSAYYRALVYAPDKVITTLNTFLQTITVPENQHDTASQTAARDNAVLEMRRDAQLQLDSSTNLKSGNLYSIEINTPEPNSVIIKPESQVTTASSAKGSPAKHPSH